MSTDQSEAVLDASRCALDSKGYLHMLLVAFVLCPTPYTSWLHSGGLRVLQRGCSCPIAVRMGSDQLLNLSPGGFIRQVQELVLPSHIIHHSIPALL